MYFLIGIWGHERRNYAALKFFIFTQAGSLFPLIAILALYFLHRQATGIDIFEYLSLLRTPWPEPQRYGSFLAQVTIGCGFDHLIVVAGAALSAVSPQRRRKIPTSWLLVVTLALTSVVGLFCYLRVKVELFASTASAQKEASVSWAGGALLAGLMILMIWLGAYPAPVVRLIQSVMF